MNSIQCPVCKRKNEDVLMVKYHDMLVCPKCRTSLSLTNESPLPRFEEDWKTKAEELFPLLRPPMGEPFLANPRLFFLYEDCYHTLLIGRYNAAIVLMGLLLEAVMKERIWLKCGHDVKGPYGECLKIIEKNGLMKPPDIRFLRKFKDEVRNPYQHSDEAQIMEGVFVPTWPIELKGQALDTLEKVLEEIKAGRRKPILLPAAEIPAIRSLVKKEYDRKLAIELFNRVYDFLIATKIKYFKQEEYDEHNKKFGTALPQP